MRTVNSGHVQFAVTVSSDRNRQLFIIRCTGQLNVWTQVSLEIKQCKSLSLFKQKIKTWIPEVCPCKLCKTYIHHVGYLRSEMLFNVSCILINIILYYTFIHSIQLIY